MILISGFNAMHEMTNNDSFKWIPGTSITFHVGMDASSIIMSLLTLLVIPLSLIATFTKKEEKIILLWIDVIDIVSAFRLF